MRRFVVLVLMLTFSMHTASTFAVAAAVGGQGTATLSGTALSSSGQLIENCTVQLRNVMTGQLVDTKACSPAGAFMFTGLNPGDYVVEIVNAQGVVIGTSAVSAVAAGATVTMTVTTAAAITAGGGIGTAVILTALAAAAGVAAVVVVVNRGQSSPSQ